MRQLFNAIHNPPSPLCWSRPPSDHRRVPLRGLGFLFLLLVGVGAHAQNFDANRYYQQCLRFEAGGDLETARQSCLNALQVKPDFTDAELALARVEIGLGDLSSAESRLNSIKKRSGSAEPLILLADIALRGGRNQDADLLLTSAQARLADRFNSELAGRLNYLAGLLAERRGLFNEAFKSYQEAIQADGLNPRYQLAEANLRFRLGDPEAAAKRLEAYESFSGDDRNPELRSLLGIIYWSMSDFDAAANQLEQAFSLRNPRDTQAQAGDLRSLAAIYYGQGNLQSANLALREASRRGNLLSLFVNQNLAWLLLLLTLVAIHLVGESRVPTTSTLEVQEGPQLWTVGQLYGILFGGVAVALAASLLYSRIVFGNLLALLTPLQATDARAVFLITLAVLLSFLTVRRVRRNGWEALERLLGRGDQVVLGIGLGIILIVITLAYLTYLGGSDWLRGFYLNLTHLTPLVVIAVVALPFTELFFRAFAFPALENRYDRSLALLISGGLSALVFATPVVLLVALGLALAEAFRQTRSGLTTLVAQLVLHLGLVIGVSFSPWVRNLFF